MSFLDLLHFLKIAARKITNQNNTNISACFLLNALLGRAKIRRFKKLEDNQNVNYDFSDKTSKGEEALHNCQILY